MRARRFVSRVIGVAQGAIGAFAIFLAYALYHNFFDIWSVLNMSTRNMTLYTLLLFIFGLLSVISGLFLIHE